jgi:hypothetical protein
VVPVAVVALTAFVVTAAAATVLPPLTVDGATVPVPGCAGTRPVPGTVPHWIAGPSSSLHPRGIVRYVGCVFRVVADEREACGAAERTPTAQPIPRQATAPATPATACAPRRVAPIALFGADLCSDIAGTSLCA